MYKSRTQRRRTWFGMTRHRKIKGYSREKQNFTLNPNLQTGALNDQQKSVKPKLHSGSTPLCSTLFIIPKCFKSVCAAFGRRCIMCQFYWSFGWVPLLHFCSKNQYCRVTVQYRLQIYFSDFIQIQHYQKFSHTMCKPFVFQLFRYASRKK